jgi:hypothetical protein
MIKINIDKAKVISHYHRRVKREKEFAPLDEKIMKKLPGIDEITVESERQSIRDKYDVIQKEIDLCSSEIELKQVLINNNLI